MSIRAHVSLILVKDTKKMKEEELNLISPTLKERTLNNTDYQTMKFTLFDTCLGKSPILETFLDDFIGSTDEENSRFLLDDHQIRDLEFYLEKELIALMPFEIVENNIVNEVQHKKHQKYYTNYEGIFNSGEYVYKNNTKAKEDVLKLLKYFRDILTFIPRITAENISNDLYFTFSILITFF